MNLSIRYNIPFSYICETQEEPRATPSGLAPKNIYSRPSRNSSKLPTLGPFDHLVWFFLLLLIFKKWVYKFDEQVDLTWLGFKHVELGRPIFTLSLKKSLKLGRVFIWYSVWVNRLGSNLARSNDGTIWGRIGGGMDIFPSSMSVFNMK